MDQIGNIKAATALADTVFRFGTGDGAMIIQRAIDEVTPGAIKSIDGRMGPETLTAFTKLASNPATLGKLLDAIARFRGEKIPGREVDRNNHFRFLTRRQ